MKKAESEREARLHVDLEERLVLQRWHRWIIETCAHTHMHNAINR